MTPPGSAAAPTWRFAASPPAEMARRVALTGIGAVTPLGNDAPATWAAMVGGLSGIGPLTTFDSSGFKVHIGGMVRDFDLAKAVAEPRLRRYLSRAGGFAVAAMVEALADAGAPAGVYEPGERGISMAGSVGRPPLDELTEMIHLREGEWRRPLYRQAPSAVMIRAQNVPVAVMAQIGGFQGPTASINTACAASVHSIGEGYRWIQDGAAKLVVAGGSDALTTYLDVLGFSLLGALTEQFADQPERASRPFDRDRSGFVLGEGAIMVVLEEMEAALARGATIQAELVGFGSSMNAYRITDSPPDGAGRSRRWRRHLPSPVFSPLASITSPPTAPARRETTAARRSRSRKSSKTIAPGLRSARRSRWPATSPPPPARSTSWRPPARSASRQLPHDQPRPPGPRARYSTSPTAAGGSRCEPPW